MNCVNRVNEQDSTIMYMQAPNCQWIVLIVEMNKTLLYMYMQAPNCQLIV
jgi:hypothetical protein